MSDLRTEPDDCWYYDFEAAPDPHDESPAAWEWGRDCDGGDMACCPLPVCFCLQHAQEFAEAEQEKSVPKPAEEFQFQLTERVCHCQSDRSAFVVTRRVLPFGWTPGWMWTRPQTPTAFTSCGMKNPCSGRSKSGRFSKANSAWPWSEPQ